MNKNFDRFSPVFMKRGILILLILCGYVLSSSYISAQEAPTNENPEINPEEMWKDKWPEILAAYNTIQDERHRLIFSNYMHRKIGPLTVNTTDEYFVYNPIDLPVFEMKTSLVIPVPTDFLQEEVKQYDRFFWNHIKAFIPFEVRSTGYDKDTSTLTVTVINPDMPGDFAAIDLAFVISIQGNNHVLTLDPGEVVKIGGIKDNTITITFEPLSGNLNYTIVTFHSLTHYKAGWRSVEDVKNSLNVFKLEDFLFENMEKLCLETEANVTKKYTTIANQEIFGLIDILKQNFIHFGSMLTPDDVVLSTREEVLKSLEELKTKVLQTNTLESFVAYNKLIVFGLQQRATGTTRIDEFFPLFNGKRIQDLLLDDKESTPSLWAEAALYDAGLANLVLLPYARRITQKYQLDNFRSLIKSGYTSSTYFQEASLTDNPYAGGAFETVIYNEAFRQSYEPPHEWFQLAQRVNQEYNRDAFIYFERWYPQTYPYNTWRLWLLRESLAVNNPHALRAFKAIVNLKTTNNDLFILATQVTREGEANQFEILANEEVLVISRYKAILGN